MADILLSLGLDTRQMEAQIRGVAGRVQQAGVGAVAGVSKDRAGPGPPLVEKIGATTDKINKQTKAVGASSVMLNKAGSSAGVLTGKNEKLLRSYLGVSKGMKQTGRAGGRSIVQMAKWAAMWTLAYGAIRLVTGAIGAVLKGYGELDDAMARVGTVTRATGRSQAETISMMRQQVLDYTSTSRAELNDVAKTLYFLGTAGLDVAQQMAGFENIMNLTIGTLGNIDEIGKLVAGSFNIFSKSIKGAATDAERFRRIADMLAFTYSTQQVELSEISSAFTLVGSAAGLLNIDFKTLVGTIGFLNTGMLKGTRAGTSLMNAFVKIAQNSDRLTETFGITFDPTKPLDFVDVMTKLSGVLGTTGISTEELRKLMDIFGVLMGFMIILQQAKNPNNILQEKVGQFADNEKKKNTYKGCL